MIKISRKADLQLMQNKDINPLVTRYVNKLFYELINIYGTENLDEDGALFYIQSQEDFDEHMLMGLTHNIYESINESTETIILSGVGENIKLIQVLYAINNSTAITVIGMDTVFPMHVKDRLMDEYIGERKIMYGRN